MFSFQYDSCFSVLTSICAKELKNKRKMSGYIQGLIRRNDNAVCRVRQHDKYNIKITTGGDAHMVEIHQKVYPIKKKSVFVFAVAVFALLGKTLLEIGLSSRVTHFFCLINATGFFLFFPKSKRLFVFTFI